MSGERVFLSDVAWIEARVVDPTKPEYKDLPHVSAEHIGPISGELQGLRTASEDGMASAKYLFSAGDVLYSKLRPYLRKATLPDFSGLCSADIYPLKADPRRLLSAYLRWVLVSDEFAAYARDLSARSRMPKLNREQLFAYEFELPDVQRQEAVCLVVDACLLKVKAAVQAGSRQLEDSLSLRAAIYRDAFQGVAPITVPPVFGEPPSGWRWRKLGDLARLESGHTPSRSRPDWWGGEVSWLSLTEIRALDGRWVERTELRTNAAGIANSAARILPRGTVCFSRTASVGFVAIMAQPMATSQDFANWVCGDELDSEFLMHALIRCRKELRELATGATHKTIYMPTLESFHVCVPPLPEQQRIVAALKQQLAEVASLRAALDVQRKELAALPQRILAQAFNP